MNNIYHITTKKLWEEAKMSGIYTNQSIGDVGFIHCSTKEQTTPTLNRRYKGVKDLVLLELDPEKIKVRVVYEDLRGIGEEHPHVYGEIPLEAVIDVCELVLGEDGLFDRIWS